MTRHLSLEEQVDALEGVLDATRHRHLRECAACAYAVEALRSTWSDVVGSAGDDVPEPSPLFWDHFARRVTEAVGTETTYTSVPWWQGSVRAWIAAGTVAAVGLLAVWTSPGRTGGGPSGTVTADSMETMALDETALAQWQFVTDMLGALEPDAATSVLRPSPIAVEAVFEALSDTERQTFARLLAADLAEGSE